MTDTTTETKTCRCGCGENVKGSYRPGHDARHAGAVARAIHADPARRDLLDSLGSDVLRAKAERMLDKLAAPKTKKASRRTTQLPAEVKVGRWWKQVTGGSVEAGYQFEQNGETKVAKVGAETREVTK